jgi:hypothetical protein
MECIRYRIEVIDDAAMVDELAAPAAIAPLEEPKLSKTTSRPPVATGLTAASTQPL